MYTSANSSLTFYLIGALALIIVISAPIVGLVILALMLIYATVGNRRIDGVSSRLSAITVNPWYLSIACLLSFASISIRQQVDQAFVMGFPVRFSTYYFLPENSQVIAHWSNVFSQIAINPLMFIINAAVYYAVFYLSFRFFASRKHQAR